MKNKRVIFKSLAIALGVFSIGAMAFQFAPNAPTQYEPILMLRSDMEAAVKLSEPRPIESPGKIWLYNDLILLIEQYKGIHIIDNSNPAASKTIGFIQVDGCTDIAMKGDIVYANNAVDMIGIKANGNYSSIEVVSRNRNSLPIISSPDPWGDWYFYEKLPANTIIVRWVPYQN